MIDLRSLLSTFGDGPLSTNSDEQTFRWYASRRTGCELELEVDGYLASTLYLTRSESGPKASESLRVAMVDVQLGYIVIFCVHPVITTCLRGSVGRALVSYYLINMTLPQAETSKGREFEPLRGHYFCFSMHVIFSLVNLISDPFTATF